MREWSVWTALRFPERRLPVLGWKLHLAATCATATRVWDCAGPLLIARRVDFKMTSTLQALAEMNAGGAGETQIGKFITAYPLSADEAVQLAHDLDDATSGVPGAVVPFDRRLRRGSVVHYRYGAVSGRQAVTGAPLGVGGQGTAADDRRRAVPLDVVDPFGGVVNPESRGPGTFVANRFLVTARHQLTGAAQVRTVIDRALYVPRVLKSALVDVPGDDGRTGCQRLRHELVMLRRLGPDAPTPRAVDFLTDDEDRVHLVMSSLPGLSLRRFGRAVHCSTRDLDAVSLVALGLSLGRAIARCHEAQVVHRDVKPDNVVVAADGCASLLDFDAAAEIGSCGPARRTGGFSAPPHGGFADPREDVYGLAATLWWLLAAEPPVSPTASGASVICGSTTTALLALRPDLPVAVCSALSSGLTSNIEDRPDLGEFCARLAASLGRPGSGGWSPTRSRDDAEPEFLGRLLLHVRTALDEAARGSALGGGALLGAFAAAIGDGSAAAPADAGALARALARSVDDLREGGGIGGLLDSEAGTLLAAAAAASIANETLVLTELAHLAVRRGRGPLPGPDLARGYAGRLLALLAVWRRSGAASVLDCARRAGEDLLALSVQPTPHTLAWLDARQRAPVGIWDGAAGVAIALGELAAATGSARWYDAAQRAGRSIVRSARAASDGTPWWPRHHGGPPAGSTFGRGSAGCIHALARLTRQGILGAEQLLAEAAAPLAQRVGDACGPTELALRTLVLAEVAALTCDRDLRDAARDAWESARARSAPLIGEAEDGPSRGPATTRFDELATLLATTSALRSGSSWSVVPWDRVEPRARRPEDRVADGAQLTSAASTPRNRTGRTAADDRQLAVGARSQAASGVASLA
jgi:hypothetical protein